MRFTKVWAAMVKCRVRGGGGKGYPEGVGQPVGMVGREPAVGAN